VTIDRTKLVSKSKNTPYHGWSFKGGVAATIVGGKVVYVNPAVETGLRTRLETRQAAIEIR
jgi:dihydroorotase